MNLKEEAYFLTKLVSERHSFKHFLSYLKYKFFPIYFIKKIPVYLNEPDSNFELHSLCQKKDIPILFWSLHSFLYYSGLRPKIFIHDDGSMDKKTAQLLKDKFNGLEVIFKNDADKFFESQNLPETIQKFRSEGHKLIHKFVDISIMSRGAKIMVLDSDILFFDKPQEIIDFVNGKSAFEALIEKHNNPYDLNLKEEYALNNGLEGKEAALMNSGLILFNRSILSIQKMIEYFNNTQRKTSDYFVEMTGWACIISQTNFDFLPLEKYHIKGRPGPGTIMKHFTSPRRHELYAYGIDMIRRI